MGSERYCAANFILILVPVILLLVRTREPVRILIRTIAQMCFVLRIPITLVSIIVFSRTSLGILRNLLVAGYRKDPTEYSAQHLLLSTCAWRHHFYDGISGRLRTFIDARSTSKSTRIEHPDSRYPTATGRRISDATVFMLSLMAAAT